MSQANDSARSLRTLATNASVLRKAILEVAAQQLDQLQSKIQALEKIVVTAKECVKELQGDKDTLRAELDKAKESIRFLSQYNSDIDGLQAKLEKLRWIPVSERLPENVRTMQVLLKAEAVNKLCQGFGFHGEDDNGFGWEISSGGLLTEVTHWKEKDELPWQALESEEGEFEIEGCNGCINLETCPSKGEKCNDFVLEGRAQDEEV